MVTLRTGVLKSLTSRLRCAWVGSGWFFSVMTTRSLCCLMSGLPLKPGALSSTMPELRLPLRKSMLAAAMVCVARAGGGVTGFLETTLLSMLPRL